MVSWKTLMISKKIQFVSFLGQKGSPFQYLKIIVKQFFRNDTEIYIFTKGVNFSPHTIACSGYHQTFKYVSWIGKNGAF